jgi:hypothetical protein
VPQDATITTNILHAKKSPNWNTKVNQKAFFGQQECGKVDEINLMTCFQIAWMTEPGIQ